MTKYAITIEERLSRTVIVDADSFTEGLDKVMDAYNGSKIVLDSEDFCGEADFKASETFGENPISEDDEQLKLFPTLDM